MRLEVRGANDVETLLRSKLMVKGSSHLVVCLKACSSLSTGFNPGPPPRTSVWGDRGPHVGAVIVPLPAPRSGAYGAGLLFDGLKQRGRLCLPLLAGALLALGMPHGAALASAGAGSLALLPPAWETTLGTIALIVLVALLGFIAFVLVRERRTGQPVEQVLNAMTDGFVVLDLNGRILYANARAEQMLEAPAARLAGRIAWDYLPPDLVPTCQDRLQSVIAEQTATEFECHASNGQWYEVRAYPSSVGVSMYIREATDRKQTEAERALILAREQAARSAAEVASCRLRFMVESSALLSSSLEYPLDALQQIAQLAVPQSADWSAAYLVGEEGTVSLLTSGETFFYPEVSDADLQALGDAEHYQQLLRLKPVSLIRVPIWVRGQVFGVIQFLMTESGRRYDADDLAMVEELARRTAAAIDHSMVYREAREAVHHAEEKERLYRLVTDNSRDIVSLHGRDGTMLYMSPSVESILGYSQEELVGTDPSDLIHPDDIRHARAAYLSLRRGTPVSYRIRRKSGEYIWFETVSQPIRDEKGRMAQIQASSRDITERKAFEEQLARQAYTDPLTGLCNRVALLDRIEHAITRATRRHQQVGVVFLDLDNFKVVNDSLGHEAGDQLLVFLARRLQACLRAEDTAARLGGDEFTILLEGIEDVHDVVRVVERLSAALQTPFTLDGHEVFVTFSIGITLSTSDQQDPRELLREADVAMYYAKHRGKARYAFFDSSMNFRLLERLDLESDLRRAVDRGEFRVHYQPMVDLASGAISGVEALVRWEHPERGLIYPDEFIPVAEETGLILPIGQWVLREACHQAQTWAHSHQGEQPLIISVNLSAGQLLQPNLPEIVARTLAETGMSPAHLQLEITETVLMHDVEAAIRVLNELKALGVQLAIDDFGTGYSALSYFKRFPFDVLKIDRAFVKGLGEDKQDSAIVRTVIMLAKTLNLVVVGEGVETSKQLGQLQVLGCDRGQGYHFARPVPGEQVHALLRSLPGELSM